MANKLTGLIDYIYQSADTVSRELVGMIPAVYLNGVAERVAVGQDVTYDIVPTMTAEDTTPAACPPALTDREINTGTMRITKSKTVRFHWTGEEETAIGAKRSNIENNTFAQAFRTIVNEIERDLAGLYVHASRAYGTPGTLPFGTPGDFSDAAQTLKILKDNGAPLSDLQLVINTAAGANIIGRQARYDIIGGDVPTLQRQGVLLDIAGFKIRESAAIGQHTPGDGAGYLINNPDGYKKGDTALAVDSGSGDILAGDLVTIDGNSYVVAADMEAGELTIAAPGLLADVADDTPVEAGADGYAANFAFDRSALHLLCRLPKLPQGGDQADDELVLVDERSGIPFRVALYRGYMANQVAIQCAWGCACVKPEHTALLLG